MEYKKLVLVSIAFLALATYVLPIDDWVSQVTAQSNDDEETEEETQEDETGKEELEEEEEELDAQGDEDKLKDGDPDANNGNGNDAKDEEDDEDDDPDGNPNNREGTPGTERCLERSNGNCANSPVHDGYGDTSEDDADIE